MAARLFTRRRRGWPALAGMTQAAARTLALRVAELGGEFE